MLVERVAGPEAKPETARVHRAHGGRRLGDDRRMRPERRTGHPRPDVTPGVLGGRRHERPDEGGVPLLRGPRLDVIRRHHAREAGGFRLLAETDQLARMELLQHGRITDLRHAANSPPSRLKPVLSEIAELRGRAKEASTAPAAATTSARTKCLSRKCCPGRMVLSVVAGSLRKKRATRRPTKKSTRPAKKASGLFCSALSCMSPPDGHRLSRIRDTIPNAAQ